MVGNLTGAVSSQSVTEEFEGTLGTVGNRADSACKTSVSERSHKREGRGWGAGVCARAEGVTVKSAVSTTVRVAANTVVSGCMGSLFSRE